jgi:integrase
MRKSPVKFTARYVSTLKPPASGQKDHWDASMPGFGLRVSAGGQKSWVVMYRHEGVKRRYTIGNYPAMSLADAREQAADILRAVAHGADPAYSKKVARKAETFADLAKEYLERHAKLKKRSWRKDDLAIERDLLPRFGRTKAKNVTRRDVLAMLDEIVERGAPIQANRTLEILRKIYNWGIGREIVETNPCHMVERPSAERRRERVLNDDEIRLVWGALEAETSHMCALFKLRLLTAQRGGEISHIRWPDIDMGPGWWTIPPEYSKNGLAHRVPLSCQATAIIHDMETLADGSDWAFPSPSGKGPITVVWKAARRIRERSGVDFVPHDLRRTAASRMTGDLEISRLVVSKVLNHIETGVTAVYDRHSYDREKRLALDAWGQRLMEIVSGERAAANVVSLGTRGEPA